jgi:hypothetical protein
MVILSLSSVPMSTFSGRVTLTFLLAGHIEVLPLWAPPSRYALMVSGSVTAILLTEERETPM